jgi:poly-beta-1,6-N-acetyl-D-glucosamine synthase
MGFIYIFILLFAAYSFLILYYYKGWENIPDFIPDSNFQPVFISVIIPARNEEANIDRLLLSLEQQSYPKQNFEIIVVDDHSTDQTSTIISRYVNERIQLIQLREDNLNSYKKKALQTGIASAKGTLIVCTDADCIVPENWLNTIAAFYVAKKPVFIAAPVRIENNQSFLQLFQTTDFMVLQGITGASVHEKFHSMSNGANLAYEREAFYEVGGFSGIDHIASGDDMLLMHKFHEKYPDRIAYLKSKDVIVSTNPAKTWKEFLNQRIRWAGKINHYKDKSVTAVLAVVYFFNLSLLLLFLGGVFERNYWYILILSLVLKFLIELPLTISICRFFNTRHFLKYFFLFQPFHVLYTVIAGFLGLTGNYTWKNRSVK